MSHFEDKMTCGRLPGVQNSLTGRVGTRNCELLFSSCFECSIVVLCNGSHLTCFMKILKSFPSKISCSCSW